jgi:hypothetical protein
MRDLKDLLSKLNPIAEEFIPPSLASPVGPGVVKFRSCRKKGGGGSAAMSTPGGTGTTAAPLVVR